MINDETRRSAMKILLTGAAGIVGTLIRPCLAEAFEEVVLLTHRTSCENLRPNERAVQGDIQDRACTDGALSGVDGIIHLAGLVGPDYTFDQVLGPNVIGTYNLFESARVLGVKRIVYASTHHAVGFLPRTAAVDEREPVRADSWYGVSKGFGEVMAAYYSDKFGLDILSVRIGSVTEKVSDERRVHLWSSPRDLARLFELGLKRKERGYRLVYGVSACPDPFFDNRSAGEIGYRPADNSDDFLSDPAIKEAVPDPSAPENLFIGGYFASGGLSEEALDLFRALRSGKALSRDDNFNQRR
jgi:uronate dehydrogenase